MGFERLRVYQAAERLDDEVEKLIETITDPRHARDIDQLLRACGSVQYNIGEAYGSEKPRRKANYLEMARGSSDEARAVLRRLAARGALSPRSIARATSLTATVSKMLTAWIKGMSSDE